MKYDDLENHVIDYVKKNDAWNRVISLDVEADLRILYGTSKTILSICVARRDGTNIDIQKFIRNDESTEDEIRIFNDFGSFCNNVKPLVIIGYGIRSFDIPILLLKMRQLEESFKKCGKYSSEYWAFRKTITRSYVLDIIDPVRFEIANYDCSTPKFVSLEDAINHERFQHLPFKRAKNIVSNLLNTSNSNKFDAIHDLWKRDKDSFHTYIEGDVHDTLLIAEELFDVELPKTFKNQD